MKKKCFFLNRINGARLDILIKSGFSNMKRRILDDFVRNKYTDENKEN